MNHDEAMGLALDQAALALDHGDIPIGAVLLRGDEVLAAAHNERELRQDPTAHAEILVLKAGAEALGSWRLTDCCLVVTLEPCPMCAGATVLARISELVYGTPDPRAGAAYSLYNIPQDPRLNHEVAITTGVREEACAALLTGFFQTRRT